MGKMKKKLAAAALAGTFMSLAITGCAEITGSGREIAPLDTTGMMLEYDEDTKIVYWKGHYRISPYYSENGKLCRYVDGEIVEVE